MADEPFVIGQLNMLNDAGAGITRRNSLTGRTVSQ